MYEVGAVQRGSLRRRERRVHIRHRRDVDVHALRQKLLLAVLNELQNTPESANRTSGMLLHRLPSLRRRRRSSARRAGGSRPARHPSRTTRPGGRASCIRQACYFGRPAGPRCAASRTSGGPHKPHQVVGQPGGGKRDERSTRPRMPFWLRCSRYGCLLILPSCRPR